MPQLSGCCTSKELKDYCANRLSPEDSERISTHLRVCDSCWSRVRAHEQVEDTDMHPVATPPAEDVTLLPSRQQTDKPAHLSFLAPPLEPNELGWLSHYRVLRVLGQGGMGLVFEAEDSHLLRRVALKVILPELAAEGSFRERFLREARTMAAVNHDHVITVYQVGMGTGSSGGEDVPFLAMEMLTGQTLDQRLAREGRMKPDDVIRMGRQIAEGLAAAHEKGLIHRDVKPANIFLTAIRRQSAVIRRPSPDPVERARQQSESGPRTNVKILDFGLARWQESRGDLSRTGQIIGTPFFMAPEQAEGKPIDGRADLFSLGAVLYNALTGNRPFDGSSTMAVLTALAVRDPKPIRELVPEAQAPLVDLIHQLLAKDPAQRPESAHVVADMLGAMEPASSGINNPPSDLRTPPPTPTPTAVPPSAPRKWGYRPWLALGAAVGVLLVLIATAINLWKLFAPDPGGIPAPTGEPILVGILHSLKGTMRESERPVLEMTQLTLDEINQQGGLLGRPVKYIIADGGSNEAIFAREAELLIVKEKVNVIFGCWTSASRKQVKEVVEEHNHLLIYPVQYEGLEESANIVYTGAAPNQQILPAVDWCIKKGYRKFFLVGSDYVFPRAANAIIADRLKQEGGEIVGHEYVLLGSSAVDDAIAKIVATRPDVILNTINGDTNLAFFRALRARGVTPQQTPTISFSLDEASLGNLDPRHIVGDYLAWNYFSSIASPENEALVKKFQAKFGDFRTVTDPMEAAHIGVRFWAQAVAEAGTTEVHAVRRAIRGQKYQAPEGPEVRVDPQTQHTWKYFRLGQITESNRIKIIESHDTPTCPMPFPPSRKPDEWKKMLSDLYQGWGKRWSNPGS